jgi:hypothetical protein
MRAATDGSRGSWLKTPADVTSVEVCVASGLRPTAGCAVEGQSIRYEYFRRGTEPQDWCELHGGRTFFEKLGSLACKLFGKGC